MNFCAGCLCRNACFATIWRVRPKLLTAYASAGLSGPKLDTEYDRAKVPPYNGNDAPPAPGSLKAPLFPPLSNEVQNKGTHGVQARYGAELPPIISIVRYPGRPVMFWRRTNVQQLTCKIDLSKSFYYLFFSFVLIELKPLVLKGKVLGEKFWKSVKKCWKVWKIMKRFCPLVVTL